MRLTSILALVGLGAVLLAGETREFALDPVLFAEGVERPGDPAISSDHYGIHYLFTSAETKARFDAAPDRYEAQLGGACARMGALSGLGKTQIYTSYNGKLYLFASESCRKTFLADPQAALDLEAAPLEPDEARQAAGRALLEQVVAAHGGAAFIDSLKDFEYLETRLSEREGKQTEKIYRMLQTQDGKIRFEVQWAVDGRWGILYDGQLCQEFTGNSLGREIHPQGLRELKRLAFANPLAVLRARQRPDYQVAIGEDGMANGQPVRHLLVAFDGLRFDLAIGRDAPLIQALSHRGHGPELLYGTLTHIYEGHSKEQGLPSGVRHQFGEAAPGAPHKLEVRLNQHPEGSRFRSP